MTREPTPTEASGVPGPGTSQRELWARAEAERFVRRVLARLHVPADQLDDVSAGVVAAFERGDHCPRGRAAQRAWCFALASEAARRFHPGQGDAQWSVFVKFHVEGQSAARIARETGLDLALVREHLHNTAARLDRAARSPGRGRTSRTRLAWLRSVFAGARADRALVPTSIAALVVLLAADPLNQAPTTTESLQLASAGSHARADSSPPLPASREPATNAEDTVSSTAAIERSPVVLDTIPTADPSRELATPRRQAKAGTSAASRRGAPPSSAARASAEPVQLALREAARLNGRLDPADVTALVERGHLGYDPDLEMAISAISVEPCPESTAPVRVQIRTARGAMPASAISIRHWPEPAKTGVDAEIHGRAAIARAPTPPARLVGIGAGLEIEDGVLHVAHLVPGGGAEQAGLQVQDIVVSIGGERVTTLGLEGSLEALRGDAGTPVKIGIVRPSQGRTDTLDVIRTVFTY